MIRKATVDDVSRISEIHVYGWRNAYKSFLSEKFLYGEHLVQKKIDIHTKAILQNTEERYVEENDGIIRGFMIVNDCRNNDKPHAFELSAIYVEPYYINKSVGSQLLGYFESLGKSRNKHEFVIWVFEKNIKARDFYKKHGYSFDGTEAVIDFFKEKEVRYAKTA